MATGSSGCQPRYLVMVSVLVPQHNGTALFDLACGSLIYAYLFQTCHDSTLRAQSN
jgi:hypothetical protein